MRNRRQTLPPNKDGTTLQTLALFIILLSFFIVLNSISTFEEEKIKPVMESIEATFANRVIRNELAPSVTEHPDQLTGEGTVLDHIDALFQSQFRRIDIETKLDDKNGLFYAQIPYKDLRRSLMDVRPLRLNNFQETGTFPELLSTMLSDNNKNLRIDIVLQVNGSIFTQTPEYRQAISQKISFLGQRIEQMGFSSTKVSIGVEESNADDMALLIIRPHTPYAPYPGETTENKNKTQRGGS